ncbi:MAG: hypothetical protein MUF67_13985, partial [Desulfobacterales bacterium]|nr:hypothetical protein [Desulfobacterales bacterium]
IGESFLWNMVRKMVKTILEAGNGKIKPSYIIELLKPENNIPLKPMAPENLILMDVTYKNLILKTVGSNHYNLLISIFTIHSMRSIPMFGELFGSRSSCMSSCEPKGPCVFTSHSQYG